MAGRLPFRWVIWWTRFMQHWIHWQARMLLNRLITPPPTFCRIILMIPNCASFNRYSIQYLLWLQSPERIDHRAAGSEECAWEWVAIFYCFIVHAVLAKPRKPLLFWKARANFNRVGWVEQKNWWPMIKSDKKMPNSPANMNWQDRATVERSTKNNQTAKAYFNFLLNRAWDLEIAKDSTLTSGVINTKYRTLVS